MNNNTIAPSLSKKKILLDIHYFRAFAILCIIGIHVHSQVKWNDNEILGNIIKVLLENSTFYFVFISGFLFQHLSKKFEFKDFLEKKFKYVLQPYLIFSIPIIVGRIILNRHAPFALEYDSNFENLSIFEQFFFYVITGSHLRPFWFIPLLVFFYVCAPLLNKIDKKPQLYWFLPIVLLFSFYFERGNLYQLPRNFLHFVPIYILGMFASRNKKTIYAFLKKHRKSLVFATIVSFYYAFIEMENHSFYLQKLISTFLIFSFFHSFSKHINKKIAKIIDFVAVYSFGLFFIHDIFEVLLKHINLHLFKFHDIISGFSGLVILYITIIVASITILYLLKSIIGKGSRKFIGV
ncbi:acyltransferase family protein [Chondrinema litorale]|uniref:acyltransferase family protein n=1 Tax=Chondrinema litorale TaxID=2994555 RepID=UPI0025432D02|nr:acyltransferase [Chondrinema litorale]UZR97165.1 acyltransferase [Chondrinema litorale]